jgi:hypothetical protein
MSRFPCVQVEYAHALEVLGHKRIIPIIIDEDYSELYRLPECLSQLKLNEGLSVNLYDEYEFDSGITQLIDIVYSSIRPLRQANWKSLSHANPHKKVSDPKVIDMSIANGPHRRSLHSGTAGADGDEGESGHTKKKSPKKNVLAGVDTKNLSKKARSALESYRSSKKASKGRSNKVDGDGFEELGEDGNEEFGNEDDLSDEMYSWVAATSEWIADHAKIPVPVANTAGGADAHSQIHAHSTSLTNSLSASPYHTPINNSLLMRTEYVPISREIAQDCAFGLILFGIHSISMLYEALSKFPLFLTEVS